jgi:hypothetical protein
MILRLQSHLKAGEPQKLAAGLSSSMKDSQPGKWGDDFQSGSEDQIMLGSLVQISGSRATEENTGVGEERWRETEMCV